MNTIKNKLNKIILLQIIFMLILSVCCNISIADEIPVENSSEQESINEPTVFSKSSILMDQNTGQILFEHNARETVYPASTTKLMTAILTLENCNLTDEVTVTKEALLGIPKGYTTASLQAGEKLTIDQLLHVLLIPSANDAANVLACHISGSVEDFSVVMNEKAKQIGCENTHFTNPSGIHNDNHYSTAYDMALIGMYACKFDKIKEVALTTNYSLPEIQKNNKTITRAFKTTDTLITPKNQYYYEYATGLKTGYTDKAKSCIVSTAKKDDMQLLCVVLGGDKTDDGKAQRETDCKTLFEYGFNDFKYTDLCKPNDIIDKSKITDIPEYLQNASITYQEPLHLLVNTNQTTTPIISLNQTQELPIQKGTVVGTATYNINSKEYKINIVLSEDLLPNNTSAIVNIFHILIGALILIILLTLIKKKQKAKESRYFKRSLY